MLVVVAVTAEGEAEAEAEEGNAPGISSPSSSAESKDDLAGRVCGVRVGGGASWASETRLGVVADWLRRRAELRRAMLNSGAGGGGGGGGGEQAEVQCRRWMVEQEVL